MSDYQVGFKIISDFDNKGADAAKQALQQVASTASAITTAQTGAKAATAAAAVSTAKFSNSLQGAAAAGGALAGVLGSGSGGLATTLRGVGAVMGGIKFGWIGVAVGAIAAVVSVYSMLRRKAAEAHAEMEKGKAAFESNIHRLLEARLERLTTRYGVLASSIRNATAASLAQNAASRDYDAAGSAKTVALLTGEKQTAVAAATSKDDKERVGLGYDAQINAVQAEARENAALYVKQAAEIELASAVKTSKAAADQVALLEKELTQTKLKEKTQEALDKARRELQVATTSEAVARRNLSTSTIQLQTVRVEAAIAETALSERQGELEKEIGRRVAALQELAQKESEAVSLQADLNSALEAAKTAAEAQAKAQGKADNAGGNLRQWITERRQKNDDMREGSKEDQKFQRRAQIQMARREKLGEKSLTKENRELVQLLDQRRRAREANEAKAAKEAAKGKSAKSEAETLTEQLAELKKVTAKLEAIKQASEVQ